MRHPIGLVLDCRDPEPLARFWTEALGYANVGAAGTYVLLVDADGNGPRLLLQQVAEAKPGKNRMHLDIHTPDVDGEVRRLEGIGASRLVDEPMSEFGTQWVVMADPEGNEFCVCSAGTES